MTESHSVADILKNLTNQRDAWKEMYPYPGYPTYQSGFIEGIEEAIDRLKAFVGMEEDE